MISPEDDLKLLEQCVLGGMLRENSVIDDVLTVLTETQFHYPAHQRVFAACRGLRERGHPADLVTVADRLKADGELDDVPYTYLAEIWDASPSVANAEYHAKLLWDRAVSRELAKAGRQIAELAPDRGTPAAEKIEESERIIFSLAEVGHQGEAVPLSVAITESCERFDRAASAGSDVTGLPTGLMDLDVKLAGLQPSELIVVAARPSVGKTAFGVGLARNAALAEQPVLFVSLEQSRVELADRLLCCQAGIDSNRFRLGNLNAFELANLSAAKDRFRQASVFIDDSPAQSVTRIAATARRLKLRCGIKLVVIDYLQLVQADARKETRQEQVANISRRLKVMARELKLPVVALAQLNRASEDRQGQKPRLSDLRESGAIEADADTVILMHREEQDQGYIDLIIAKQRNGPTGSVSVAFRRECMKFENFQELP